MLHYCFSYAYLLLPTGRLCFRRCYLVTVVCLFVRSFVSRFTLNYPTDFQTKFGGNAAHGSRKKPLDFGGNPDHNILGLRLG